MLYPNQFNDAPGKLNPVLQQAEDEHKKRVAYYQQQLGSQLTGSEVLYPDNIEKNSRGETITPYKDWAAHQQRQSAFAGPVQTRSSSQQGQRESSLSGVAQPTRQQRLYAQAAGNATDAASQRQVNEHGYYRPDNSEFDHINRGADAALGYRNRNPGNVRYDGASRWDGMVSNPRQNDFIQFENDHYGIRSIARNVLTQYERGDYNTISGLLNSYAPRNQNNTQAYINHLTNVLGVGADEALDMNNPEVLDAIVPIIITHETGSNQYTPEQIRNAVRDAMDRQ